MAPQNILGKARFRTILIYAGAIVFIAAAIIAAGAEIKLHIAAVEEWITSLGPSSVLVFVGLFVITTCFLMPDTILSIMAGALFGLPWGIAAVVIGSLLAAMLQYALAHRLLRARITRFLSSKPSLLSIQQAVSRNEIKIQALIRLTPLNPATVNYMLGAAGVRFAGFMLSCLALVPNLAIEVYFGYAGKHIAGMAGRSTHEAEIHDITVIGGFVVTLIVMLFVSMIARKAVLEAVSKTEKDSLEKHV